MVSQISVIQRIPKLQLSKQQNIRDKQDLMKPLITAQIMDLPPLADER